MPRNGAIAVANVVVTEVFHVKTGTSRIVAKKGQWTITLEKVGAFPDDMHVRPDGTLDLRVDYDPK